MSYKTIIFSDEFIRRAKKLFKKYRSLKTDVANLQQSLLENPYQGTVLGENQYKVRLAIKSKGKGKSGGARVIIYLVKENEEIYLLTIYDKEEIDNVSDAYLKQIIKEIFL